MVRGVNTIIILLLCWASTAVGQHHLSKKVSISLLDVTVEDALTAISDAGHFYFSYNPTSLPVDKKINLVSRNQTVKHLLHEILGNDFLFQQRGSYVIIKARGAKGLEKIRYQVMGSIKDARTAEVIKNVTVYEVERLTSTLTEEDGAFSLPVSDESGYVNLAISKAHYRDTMIRVSRINPLPINVTLTPKMEVEIEATAFDSIGIVQFMLDEKAFINARNVELVEERFFNLSLLPVSGATTQLSGMVTNKNALNIIAGYSYGIAGVELGGGLNMVRNEVKGVQVGGIGNIVGGKASGVQMAGLANIVTDTAAGFQVSGIINSSECAHGMQLSGVGNFTKEMRGIQVSGIVNVTTGKTFKGVQIAGVFNYTKTLRGGQIGVFNYADTVSRGVPIGLISFVKKGFRRFEVAYGDAMHSSLWLKTGVPRFYNIIGVGYRLSGERLWSYGYGLGTQFQMGKKLYGNVEAISNSVHTTNGWVDGLNLLNDLNLTTGYQFTPRTSINAGPVLHVHVRRTVNPEEVYATDLTTAPFYDQTSGMTNVRMWVGYRAAFRF